MDEEPLEAYKRWLAHECRQMASELRVAYFTRMCDFRNAAATIIEPDADRILPDTFDVNALPLPSSAYDVPISAYTQGWNDRTASAFAEEYDLYLRQLAESDFFPFSEKHLLDGFIQHRLPELSMLHRRAWLIDKSRHPFDVHARTIQRAWRRCISNPHYVYCRHRLKREAIDLSQHW